MAWWARRCRRRWRGFIWRRLWARRCGGWIGGTGMDCGGGEEGGVGRGGGGWVDRRHGYGLRRAERVLDWTRVRKLVGLGAPVGGQIFVEIAIFATVTALIGVMRSEERRVGKECR